MTHTSRNAMRNFVLRLGVLCAAGLALPAAGCSGLLDVSNPDIVTPDNITDAAALPTVRAGAIGDFTFGYSGSGAQGSQGRTEGIIMISGLLGDEWINSETFPTRIEVDARITREDNATMQTIFRDLHRARRAVELAATKYQELDAGNTVQLPEMLALAGYTYLFFAENYCSGVPVSTALPSGQLIFGPPLTRTQLLDTAIARFDAAIAVSSSNTITRLATVGKGRAQLDEDLPAAASTTVAGVPTSFVYRVEHTLNTGREENGVFKANVAAERYSVADREGGNGLPFRSVVDPRTPFERTVGGNPPTDDVGFDGATPQFDALRYGDEKAPVPVATGVEARLIQAEALLRAGSTAWLDTLNALRAAPQSYFNGTRQGQAPIPVMGPLADPGTLTGRQDLLFAERARWLWLTGQRLSDMRRLIRQYGRGTETVFPTGAYFKQGRVYGTDVNFPVPIDEENNPNFVQCIDKNP
jgi:starch-binding outer membrane protein, SusD/RagB family